MQTQTQVTAEMIQQSLNNFFDRGGRLVEDEPVYVSEPEPEVIPEPEPVALSIHAVSYTHLPLPTILLL